MSRDIWQQVVDEKTVNCPCCGQQLEVKITQAYRHHETLGVVKDGNSSGSTVCKECNISLTYTEEVENATDDVKQLTIIPLGKPEVA